MATLRHATLASVIVAAFAGPFVVPVSGIAQSRYDTWTPPGTTSTSASANRLLNDLKALVDDAERDRAANPVFLKDLRDLMARYKQSGTQRILFDDFADGDFTRNPTWTVISGEYWIEQGYGLRSKLTADQAATSSTVQSSKEQLALSILGAVLQGANKNKTNTPPSTVTKTEPAVLSARTRLSNAFVLASQFSSWAGEGDFAFAITQGTGGAGYRVVYTPKQTARSAKLELVRVTKRGEGVIDSASITGLEDKKNHALNWVRAKDGSMTVTVDNKQILRARDTTFRDPFDAVALVNAGTDVIVKSVEVLGNP